MKSLNCFKSLEIWRFYNSRDIGFNVSAADCRTIGRLNAFIDYAMGFVGAILFLLFVVMLIYIF